MNWRLRRLLNAILFLLIIVAVVAGLVYLSISRKTATDAENKPKMANRFEPGSLEEVLATGNVAQLINRYNEILQEDGGPVNVRTDRLNRRIQLADRLLEFSDDPHAIEIGTTAKLIALSIRDQLNVVNNLSDDGIRKQLLEMARAHQPHQNARIENTAVLAEAIAKFNEYIGAPQKDDFPDVLAQLTEAASRAANDAEIADVLFGLTALARQRKLDDESSEMLKVIADRLSTSNLPAVQQISAAARRELIDRKFGLKKIRQSIEQFDMISLDEIQQAIVPLLESDEAGDVKIEQSIVMIESLLHQYRNDDAVQLLAATGATIEKLPNEPSLGALKQQFANLAKRLGKIGSPFEFEGVTNAANDVFSENAEKPSLKLLVFWSASNVPSIQRIETLHKQSQHWEKNNVRLIAVQLDDGSQRSHSIATSLAAEMRGAEFWRIDVRNQALPSFFQQFPIDDTPMVVLLSRQNNIVGIDLALDQLKFAVSQFAN
jgi:hypothetical protein